MNMRISILPLLTLCLLATLLASVGNIRPAFADEVRPYSLGGTVTVTRIVDGDSLRSGDLQIRIHGIDAPEMRQSCVDARGRSWACGKAARTAMSEILSTAAQLECELRDVDRYGRLVMRCMAGDTDIAAALVRRGLALAYRRYATDYVEDEQVAAQEATGMWQGKFETPWDWRRAN